MNDDTVKIINTIELALIKGSILGFDPDVLYALDNDDIGQREIENLKYKLGSDVLTYLFNIANSAYHGSLKMGQTKNFFDVVNRVGTQYVKVQILMYSMKRLAGGDHDAEIIFARDFAASVVGRVMARGFGFRDEAARMVELACLLSSIGALMMTVYRKNFHTKEFIVSDEFIEQNQQYLTERIIRRFKLPEYLRDMIIDNAFTLERMAIALPAVVKLAVAVVDWSFRISDNKLMLRSPIGSLEDRLAPTLALIIADQFAAAGLNKHIVVLQDIAKTKEEIL